MKFILISKTSTYGDIYFNSDLGLVSILSEKIPNNLLTPVKSKMAARPPYFFALLILFAFSICIWAFLTAKKQLLLLFMLDILVGTVYYLAFYLHNRFISLKSSVIEINLINLEKREQLDFLEDIEESVNILYCTINRFIGGFIAIAIFSFAAFFFYDFSIGIYLIHPGIIALEFCTYILSFSSRRRRMKIYKILAEKVNCQ